MSQFVRTLISGFLLLLPVVITAVLVIWIAAYVFAYVRPGSMFGNMLTAIGLGFTGSTVVAYAIGLIVLVTIVYLLGLIVESRLRSRFSGFIDGSIRRIPVVRNVYDLTKRFVAIMDQKDADGLKGMRPVWCHFGGAGGAAVLALLPSPEHVDLNGIKYHAILVPSAPVPIGGGLIYVPAEWIQPAEIGVEGLMSVYVSMGVSLPVPPAAVREPRLQPELGPTSARVPGR